MKQRRNHDAGLKARAALEAVKGERTVSDLAVANDFSSTKPSTGR